MKIIKMANCLKSITCFICLTAFGCSLANGQHPPKSVKPVLTIIGGDVSSSLTPDELLDSSHIRSACTSIEASGRGGTVAFDAIGNPSTRKLLRCTILPNSPVDRTLPPTRRKEAEKWWKQIQLQNARAVQVFVDSCYRRLTVPLQAHTDLNGFFRKVNKLCSEPQFVSYDIIIFVNSDMHHDLMKNDRRETTLKCQLPTAAQLWICGTESNQGFNAKYTFEAPDGFTVFFQQYLKSSENGKF